MLPELLQQIVNCRDTLAQERFHSLSKSVLIGSNVHRSDWIVILKTFLVVSYGIDNSSISR